MKVKEESPQQPARNPKGVCAVVSFVAILSAYFIREAYRGAMEVYHGEADYTR